MEEIGGERVVSFRRGFRGLGFGIKAEVGYGREFRFGVQISRGFWRLVGS